jgi:hypothetical protein
MQTRLGECCEDETPGLPQQLAFTLQWLNNSGFAAAGALPWCLATSFFHWRCASMINSDFTHFAAA